MRPDLMALLGHRITITNPNGSSSWTGKLVAVGLEPCVTIDVERGSRVCLPQSFTVTRAEVAPDSDLVIHAYRHDWLNADATTSSRTAARENTLIGRLEAMLANLGEHIDQRAAEAAAVPIEDAQTQAAERISVARREQQRAEDLTTELRRQVRALQRRAEEARQSRDAAQQQLQAVRAALAEPITPDPGANEFTVATWQRGYQACADHITRAFDRQEADRG